MYQVSPVPALGLTLAISRDDARRLLDTQIDEGLTLAAKPVESQEALDDLKRKNWDWVLRTSEVLKQCFFSEASSLFFSSNVYVQPSVKLNDFERECEEFPPQIRDRIGRLQAFCTILQVVPEPPCGQFIAAQFHPRIYNACWRFFELAQYDTAISTAIKEIEDTVKVATVGAIQKFGAELCADAFNPDADQLTLPVVAGASEAASETPGTSVDEVPADQRGIGALVNREASYNECVGVRDLFVGFMHRYRNPAAHAIWTMDECSRVLSLASYLMYTLDVQCPVPEAPAYEFELLKDD